MNVINSRMHGKKATLSLVLSMSVLLQNTCSCAAFVPQTIQTSTAGSNIILSPQQQGHFEAKTKHFVARDDDETSSDDDSKNNLHQNNKKKYQDDDGSPSWLLPSDHYESAERRARMVKLHEEMQSFVHGSELQNLRNDIVTLKKSLQSALKTDNIGRIVDLYSAIESAQEKDPEFVYSRILQKMEKTRGMNVRKKYKLLPKYIDEAMAVRKYIPRLNMEGLWIGK